MSRLTWGFTREMMGRWGLPLWLIGLWLATRLCFGEYLGDASIGSYLAYVSLWPIALLLRAGRLLHRRQAEGWPLEERIRDANGWRAPMAELLSLCLLCLAGLALALAPLHWPGLSLPKASSGYFPVQAEVVGPGTWDFQLGGSSPPGANLLLTLDGAALTPADVKTFSEEGLPLRRQEVEVVTARAGEVVVWPLSEEEAAKGQVVIQVDPSWKLRPFRHLTRLVIPRPGVGDLPALLGLQALFFLPLYAFLLALHRFGRVRAGLASWGVFFLGSLAVFSPPPMHQADLPWPVALLLQCKALLPDLQGCMAVGHRFERLAGTTTTQNLLLWLLLGMTAALLASRRRLPTKGGQ